MKNCHKFNTVKGSTMLKSWVNFHPQCTPGKFRCGWVTSECSPTVCIVQKFLIKRMGEFSPTTYGEDSFITTYSKCWRCHFFPVTGTEVALVSLSILVKKKAWKERASHTCKSVFFFFLFIYIHLKESKSCELHKGHLTNGAKDHRR